MLSTNVEGLYLVKNFLRPEEENTLVKKICSGIWGQNRSKTRRIQTYGAYHDSSYRTTERYTSYPGYSEDVLAMIEELREDVPETRTYLTDEVMQKLSDPQRSELFVNEYVNGNDLYAHHDNRTTYEECIIGISLISDIEMEFSSGRQKIRVTVPKRSLYLMTGKARYVYRHGIPYVSETRLSLTYRTLKS